MRQTDDFIEKFEITSKENKLSTVTFYCRYFYGI